LIETLDVARAAWPERIPLTMRVGAVDYHPESHPIEGRSGW
jgi:hypothetical protein